MRRDRPEWTLTLDPEVKVQSVGAFTFGILAQIPPDPENPGFPAYRVYPLIHPFTTTPDELSVGFIRLFSHSFSKWHCGVNLRSCLFSPLFFLPLFVSLSFFLLFLPLSFRLWFEYMSERERGGESNLLLRPPLPLDSFVPVCLCDSCNWCSKVIADPILPKQRSVLVQLALGGVKADPYTLEVCLFPSVILLPLGVCPHCFPVRSSWMALFSPCVRLKNNYALVPCRRYFRTVSTIFIPV
mgnify:CR=1 FL=1